MLNPREEQLARLMVSGISTKQAIETVGYKSYTPTTKAVVRERIQDILDEKGLTLDLVTKKLLEGLDATKIVGTKDDFVEVPDYIARHKYIDTLLRLRDQYPSEKHKVEVGRIEDRLRGLYGKG